MLQKTVEEILTFRDSNNKALILLVNEGCAGCASWEALLENANLPVDIFKLVVTPESLPLMAPPVVPSVIALENGYRVWEALGALDSIEPFQAMVNSWMLGEIDVNTISGTESLISI